MKNNPIENVVLYLEQNSDDFDNCSEHMFHVADALRQFQKDCFFTEKKSLQSKRSITRDLRATYRNELINELIAEMEGRDE